jgi:hypothetical protein
MRKKQGMLPPWVLALFFSALVAWVALLHHSIAQQPGLEPGYFLHVNLGPGWQTAIHLTNLDRIGKFIFPIPEAPVTQG